MSPAGQDGESGTLCQKSGGGESCQTGITAGQAGRTGGQKGGNCEGEEVKRSPGLYRCDASPNAHLLLLYPSCCHPIMCTWESIDEHIRNNLRDAHKMHIFKTVALGALCFCVYQAPSVNVQCLCVCTISTIVRIQFRLPDGSSLTTQFPLQGRLQEVRQFVVQVWFHHYCHCSAHKSCTVKSCNILRNMAAL